MSSATRLDPTLEEDRARGLRLLDDGKPDEAVVALRRALQRDARDVATLGGLAVALHRAGRVREAVARMRQRVRLRPDVPGFHHDLGLALVELGEAAEAIAAFERAVALQPDFVAARVALADALLRRGAFDAAEPHYRRAIALDAAWSVPRTNLAALMIARRRIDEALALYREALDRDPTDVEAANGLGCALMETGRLPEAVERLRAAADAAPAHVATRLNLGRALRMSGDVDAAIATHRALTGSAPAYADAWDELAQDLLAVDALDEAVAAARRAVDAAPRRAMLHAHLGNALADAGRPADALVPYRQALRLDPRLAIARWNLALAELTVGDFMQGWKDYEARWECADFPSPRRRFDVPPLSRLGDAVGRTVLVHAEQGFGDTLQFVRLVPLLREAGARTITAVPAPLRRLLTERGDAGPVVSFGETPPPFDLHIPMLSLPLLLGAAEPHGAAVPYLRSRAPERVGARRRVGIAWSGARTQTNDRRRSLRLARLASTMDRDDVEWVGLQKEVRPSDAEAFAALAGRHPSLADGTALGDFADTADVVDTLDLVITVDTSVAHLAAAMGRPTWILLHFAADFRWGVDGDRTSWYPTARLFRCATPGGWDDVLDAVSRALDEEGGAG